MKKIQKKKNKKGFTLVEMLVVVVLLILMSAMMVSTIKFGTDQFVSTVRFSEATTLTSTINTIISDELRYATDICLNRYGSGFTNVEEWGSYSYTSPNVGTYARIITSGGAVYVMRQLPNSSGNPEFVSNVLADTTYYSGNLKECSIEDLKVTYSSDTAIFHVTYNVMTRNGQKILTDGTDAPSVTMDVKVLNPNIVENTVK